MTTPDMAFTNTYEDARRAEAYAKLEFPGTYYLAYRDLPQIIAEHCNGTTAIDFGCGAGRSTRFVKRLGFDVVGLDSSEEMLLLARSADPQGMYQRIMNDDFGAFADSSVDLILSAFTFDNLPTMQRKVKIFTEMRRVLSPGGKIVNLVSSPEIYLHEWASFSTKDFPENHNACCGDVVKIINTDINDRRPVEDILWPDRNYRDVYEQAGLVVVQKYEPLAKESEPFQWVNETRIAPWVIYVLRKTGRPADGT
jgi:ubiquinone/menaquinone biosynthesis C-methylase UbiE